MLGGRPGTLFVTSFHMSFMASLRVPGFDVYKWSCRLENVFAIEGSYQDKNNARQDKRYNARKTGHDTTVKQKQGCSLPKDDKTRQDKTRQEDKARQDKARHGKTRHDKTRQDKTGQDKTRQDKTRRDKTRRDKTR
jgi:hypothetical protein